MADPRAPRRAQARRRRATVTGVTVVVLAGAGGVAWAMTRSGGPTYRLASATSATVRQTVTTTGTIRTVDQAAPAFAVDGVVATVRVQVGSVVRSGQTIATLDRRSLDQAVEAAGVSVASARQTLADDEAAQVAAAGTTSTTAPSGATASAANSAVTSTAARVRTVPTAAASTAAAHPGRASGGGTSAALAAAVVAVRRAQGTVVRDQRSADLDADLATADRTVAAERQTCAAILGATSSPTTSSPAPSTSGAPTAGTPPSSGPASSSGAAAPAPSSTTPAAAGSSSDPAGDLSSCQSAIDDVETAQAAVQSDLRRLTTDEAALDRAVSALVRAVEAAPSGSGASSVGRSAAPASSPEPTHRTATGSSAGTASGNRNGGGGSGGVITAATIAADEKAIDAAGAQVAVTRQDAALATLTAPIGGRVASVGITVGQSVSAGSSTATIAILGGGQKSVSTTVGIGDIDAVKVGTAAIVTVAGVAEQLAGRVSYVGILNTSGTSGSTSTYPVTVLLDPTAEKFYDGAGATVALQVGSADNALTVPTSAVHRLGTRTTVDLYSGGSVTTTRVTLGVVGAERTQVLSGLRAGQRVVLATVSAPVPTSSVNQRLVNRLGGAGGGLTGAGRVGGRTGG